MLKNHLKKQFNRAVELEKKGEYQNAFYEYCAILQEDPNFRNAYLNLGSLYSRMNKLPEAMACYEKALTLGDDYLTQFNIGSIFYKLGKHSEALSYLKKSSKLNKKFILTRLVMGLCYSKLNKISSAKKNFQNVLKSWPDNRVALTALSIIYFNQEKYPESLQLLDRLLIADSQNIKLKQLKWNILYKTGKIDESAAELKSLKTISNGFRYYDEFIQSIPEELYSDKYGTLDDKIKLLKNKIDTDTNSIISLSLCHLLKGESDIAIDYLFELKKKFMN